MERLCFTLELHPGQEQEYERRHREIWPEMETALNEAGYRNYSLFRRGTLVVGYAECDPDVATVLGRIATSEINLHWAESFGGVIGRLTDEDGRLICLQELWHLS